MKDVTLALVVSVPDEVDPDQVGTSVDIALDEHTWEPWEISEATVESVSAPYGIQR